MPKIKHHTLAGIKLVMLYNFCFYCAAAFNNAADVFQKFIIITHGGNFFKQSPVTYAAILNCFRKPVVQKRTGKVFKSIVSISTSLG